MEQNRFDLDQMRQQWCSYDDELSSSDWAAPEVSHVLHRYKVKKRRQHVAGFFMSIGMIATIGLILGGQHDILTNQPGLDNAEVASIMDQAFADMNQNIVL